MRMSLCSSASVSIGNSPLAIVACTVIAATLTGCDEGQTDIGGRVAVSGEVTLDGKPLKAAAIVFHCAGNDSTAGEVTAFGFVEDGRYRIEDGSGPVVGEARVEFRPKPIEREAFEEKIDQAASQRHRRVDPQPNVVAIPERYGEHSEIRVELVDSEENLHNFQLTSRP